MKLLTWSVTAGHQLLSLVEGDTENDTERMSISWQTVQRNGNSCAGSSTIWKKLLPAWTQTGLTCLPRSLITRKLSKFVLALRWLPLPSSIFTEWVSVQESALGGLVIVLVSWHDHHQSGEWSKRSAVLCLQERTKAIRWVQSRHSNKSISISRVQFRDEMRWNGG